MHKQISINNFKCFSEKTDINLSNINVCLGSNSVGKSSVIQGCILIRQIYEKALKIMETKPTSVEIQLNDEYGLQLGDSEHIKSSKKMEDIVLGIDDLEFVLSSISGNPYEMIASIPKDVDELKSMKGLFADNFYYLNAERLGPRNYQTIDAKVVNGCGVHGENTNHFLSKMSTMKVAEERCFNLDEAKKVNTVAKQVEYWMNYIIPGINILPGDIMDLRLSKIQFQQTTLDTDFLSPYSFGFGISYVLPIILTGLVAENDSVFLVENPEAHLHPMGQSHIGYFLAMMAFSGIQVIVETHSEHVLNGIRIAALKQKQVPDNISFNFFSIHNEGEKITHRVEKVLLSERMDIQSWPEGFMDQEEQDLRTIRELRRQ